jgi:hypothetical protein
VSYLTCSNCGLTLFDRNPLSSPRHCPRCARLGLTIDLERVASKRARAAASLLSGQEPKSVEGAKQARG